MKRYWKSALNHNNMTLTVHTCFASRWYDVDCRPQSLNKNGSRCSYFLRLSVIWRWRLVPNLSIRIDLEAQTCIASCCYDVDCRPQTFSKNGYRHAYFTCLSVIRRWRLASNLQSGWISRCILALPLVDTTWTSGRKPSTWRISKCILWTQCCNLVSHYWGIFELGKRIS